jgi:hypothetical protein
MLSKKDIILGRNPRTRGYYFMNKWLEGFAYKMNPAMGMVIIVGVVSFLMAWPHRQLRIQLI